MCVGNWVRWLRDGGWRTLNTAFLIGAGKRLTLEGWAAFYSGFGLGCLSSGRLNGNP